MQHVWEWGVAITVHVGEPKVGAVEILAELDLPNIHKLLVIVVDPASDPAVRFHAEVVNPPIAAEQARISVLP